MSYLMFRDSQPEIIKYRFSIVIPSRERYSLLIRTLDNIYFKADNPNKIESIVIIDNDDEYSEIILKDYKNFNNFPVKIFKVNRGSNLNKDYYQYGFQQSSGKYLWGLGNDCEIITQHWDSILEQQIESFLVDKKDRLCYTYIGDDLNFNKRKWMGCCFPVFTREVFTALGCTFPIEIEAYGADHWVWQNFKKCRYNRILDIRDIVQLKHYANFNGRTKPDKISARWYVPRKCELTEKEEKRYINLIKIWIEKTHEFKYYIEQ